MVNILFYFSKNVIRKRLFEIFVSFIASKKCIWSDNANIVLNCSFAKFNEVNLKTSLTKATLEY